ncbi:unnamed protein product [Owenia fusiformis]|uniref:Cilia- and flagella-associated protein 418 n=1 Tax=Owenia fusiformis TaxID=6347 RepID=A0A8J1TTD8_OWEFU|nr:unnamed protein product [Owenia fusiformis]
MADDIDDLLDEVEEKFVTKTPTKRPESKPKIQVNSSNKKNRDSDLDDMINDICDVPEPLETLGNNVKDTEKHERIVTSAQKKCYPIYLGGSNNAQGIANTINQRTCDRLRCTDCDFKIVNYDNYQWHSSVDYLFLRNNVPDLKKLSAKLVQKKGYRAYACQCKWKSVNDIVNLNNLSDLKWICGKH